MWLLGFCIFSLLIAFPFPGSASETYAGKWKMTSMTLGVKVDSWGEFCGPRPISYASQKTRPVTIRAEGNHLVFSSGGLRTDRCGSPNPRLRKISQKVSQGSWNMVCETEQSDPKYERGVYKLIAKGEDTLEYRAESKFDWSLKGDHCVAVSDERRLFVRAEEEPDGEAAVKASGAEKKPMPGPASTEKTESLMEERSSSDGTEGQERRKLDINEPWCDSPGPAKKIVIHPQRHRLAPGESVCFKALAVDAEGCRTPLRATWSAMQNAQPVKGPLRPNGCFHAGETAADAEGTYLITARVGQKSAKAEVSVVFPDLGELFAARLRPLQHLDSLEENGLDDQPQAPTAPSIPQGKGYEETVQSIVIKQKKDEDRSSSIIWLIVGLLGVAFVGFASVVALGVKRRRNLAAENDHGEEGVSRERVDGVSGIDKVEDRLECPECGSEFPPHARFCPHDGSALAPSNKDNKSEVLITGSRTSAGMVCPKCHRGYDENGRFCPHDSSRLVPYGEWRKNRTGREGKN